MTPDVSIIAAFVAGVLSISSPCVLPLVPLYLSHIAGVSAEPGLVPARSRVMANAVSYVAGFSCVFIAVGVALGAAGALVSTGSLVAEYRYWLVRLGGAVLLFLGLHQIGLVRIGLLDRQFSAGGTAAGTGRITSSFIIGASFGAGWSPCAGPILGAILTMAAGQGDPNRAGILLAAYSAGLAAPFLGIAAFGASSRMLGHITRRTAALSSASGAIMLAAGVIMMLGIYEQLFVRLAAMAPWTPWEPNIL